MAKPIETFLDPAKFTEKIFPSLKRSAYFMCTVTKS